MKKVLIAMGNKAILEQVKKCGKYIVYKYDVDTKENVLEYLSKYEADVIVTKDKLGGDKDRERYIKEIKKVNPKIKIIICVENLDERYKGFLLANNVFNIIEGTEIRFSNIIEMIDAKEGSIVFKQTNQIVKTNMDNKINIMTKQKIAVFGTSGAGKSYIASIIAQITSKKLKLNTLLVDMDIQNAAIDIYNNLNCSGNNLQYVMEEIDKDAFDAELLQDLTSKSKKNGRLSFITNNMGIYECQNKISEEYYYKLYKEAESRYDILILDMPSTPFLDVVPFTLTKADEIFFVINPNFISIRQAIKYLDLMTNIWKIDISRIYIVINKVSKESLGVKQIASILKDYKVCMVIKESEKVERIINGMEEINIDGVDGVDNLSKIFGIDVDKKVSMLESLIGERNGN